MSLCVVILNSEGPDLYLEVFCECHLAPAPALSKVQGSMNRTVESRVNFVCPAQWATAFGSFPLNYQPFEVITCQAILFDAILIFIFAQLRW